MYLKKEVSAINVALDYGFSAYTRNLTNLLFKRESKGTEGAGRPYLADPETDLKTSISDKVEISLLHVFGDEIQYEPKDNGGRGDGAVYTGSADVTLIVYAAPNIRGLFDYVESTLSRLSGVTLLNSEFSAATIREKYLFLEKDINHDRQLFAITYRLRANTCTNKRGLSRA